MVRAKAGKDWKDQIFWSSLDIRWETVPLYDFYVGDLGGEEDEELDGLCRWMQKSPRMMRDKEYVKKCSQVH